MCLITPNKKVKTAEEDIIVYKMLNQDFSAFFHSHFSYELGQVYTTNITQTNEWSCFDTIDSDYLDKNYPNWRAGLESSLISISKGFHSAKTIERLHLEHYNDSDLDFRPILVECTIPKGSKYWEDNTDLVVSNQIIINRVVPQEESSTT